MIPERIRRFENLHIVLWLLKDSCWVLNLREMGMFMIIPTIGVAFFITWLSRKNISELFHNIAVCCWITANSIWMTGEFYYNDELRGAAAFFFILGLVSVLIFYVAGRRIQKASDLEKEPVNKN